MNMAIKLIRKHEEITNIPIKLEDNLFIKINDISKETLMSIDELVNYFIEEALKQVEFEDYKETTEETIPNNLQEPKKQTEMERLRKEYTQYVKGRLEEELGKDYDKKYENRIRDNLRNRVKTRKLPDVYLFFHNDNQKAKQLIEHYIESIKSDIALNNQLNPNSPIKKPIHKKVMSKEVKTERKNNPEVIVIPSTYNRDQMISKLKFALKCNNSKISFNGCLTNVYDRMKKVYGYNMNEEKKRYYNTYKVHATSTIEVVKTFDDLWEIFWTLLQTETGIDYSKIV